MFQRSAVAALTRAQNAPWVPQYCLRQGFRWRSSDKTWQLQVRRWRPGPGGRGR